MRKTAKIFQTINYWPTRLILNFFFHHKVECLENLKELEGRSIIFASNHLSFIDPLLAATSVPMNFLPVRFLASSHFLAHLIKNIFIIFYIWIHGSIWIKKNKGDLPTVLKEVVSVLKRGEKIWIFPEGKRSSDGKLGQGKRGVAYLHKETGAPIVPVAFIGTFGILLPRALLRAFFGLKKIRIVFGKPIYSLGECSLEEGADKVMSAIKDLMIQFNDSAGKMEKGNSFF